MFHDQWQKEKNECRIYPPSPFPWNRHSKVRGIYVFKRLQKFFFCYGKQTISSLLRLSSLFKKEHTTSVGKYVHQFPFSFISCLPLRFFLFSCRLTWLSLSETKTKKYDASLAHILELFRQAHPETQLFELPVHGKRPNQKIKDNLDSLLDYL